ncbi:MAG: prepilin-type N-terminal cleavage/methylation domain-containing protein [Verrucomicrobiales bacterium]|jgi:prepilin-type N-terminal cleavage/methylation domain-containing protein|nr:prepilin-type N-terminal cleavage/methylation domain-containing protein [Verrucomicrobiales bacterium]
MRPPRTAFTLIELLVVVAIAGVLVAIAIPSMRGLGKSHSVNHTVVTISGLLNHARQEAVTKNTYVYVAFNKVVAADDDTLWLVAFSADNLDWPAALTASLPSDQLPLITAPRAFEHFRLRDRGELVPASLPAADDDNPNVNALAEANLTVSVGGKTLRLNRLLVFTPGGQAMSETELNQAIEFGLVSSQDTGHPPRDPAVFRVSGNLGTVTVYRN